MTNSYDYESKNDAAFRWDDGVMTELNALVINGEGYDIEQAFEINNVGQIVANARYRGQTHAGPGAVRNAAES